MISSQEALTSLKSSRAAAYAGIISSLVPLFAMFVMVRASSVRADPLEARNVARR